MLFREQFKILHRKNIDQGFSTLEILVSIIIALAFVSVTLQSYFLALTMKVQAQEKQRANQLIQEDLERLSELGNNIPPGIVNTVCNSPNYAGGYAQDLWDLVEPAGTANPTAQLLSNGGGKTLQLSRTHVSRGNPPTIPESSTAPHRVLKVNYQVQEIDGAGNTVGDVIAQRYVEVIPDVALRCP